MLKLFYNAALLVYAILMLPKWLWQWSVQGKYRTSLSARLGFKLPKIALKPHQKLFWIHAVSMGETRASIPLFRQIRSHYPDAAIVISSTTETGHMEARRSMPEAAAHFFLPLDFSWSVSLILKHLPLTALILVESDFWYNLLYLAKQSGARIFLVNGKISERSARRFQKIPFFTRRLFANFDQMCVQSERYQQRFLELGIPPEKLHVTGNLKFDTTPKKLGSVALQHFKDELGIQPTDRLAVIGSTHEPEEHWLLSALDQVWQKIPELKVLIVPRHPERFDSVATQLKQRGIATLRYSQRAQKKGDERIVLIDTMGLLNSCYQLAEVAIVAGSFVSHVGGHNIFEPVLYHVPVLFGPHMHTQLDLVDLVLQGQAGRQVTLEQLPNAVLELLNNPLKHKQAVQAAVTLSHAVQGSAMRTFQHLVDAL